MTSVAEVYRKTRKTPDLFWNTYVCRPVAAVVVYALRDTRVTPNQVTLVAFVVAAVSAAMLIGLDGYLGALAAVIVFELSYVLDCVDGMLARYRGIQSTSGHLLDFLMDEIKAFMILAAVAVRLYRDHAADWYLLLGIGGLVCLATGIAITTFQRRPEIAGPAKPTAGAPARRSLLGRVVGLVESVAKLLIHYPSYILLVAIAGRLEYFFFPYIAVNALYAARALLGVAVRFGRA
jgi:phosphatidylglycerophosphate synthase